MEPHHDRLTLGHRARRLAALVCCAGLGLSAHAQLSGAGPVDATSSTARTLRYTGGAGSYPTGRTTSYTTASGVTVSDPLGYAFLGPIGATIAVPATGAMAVSRTIGWPLAIEAVGSWVSACAGVPACVGGAAVTAAAVGAVAYYRYRGMAPGLGHDSGQGTQAGTVACRNYASMGGYGATWGGGCYTSPTEAANAAIAAFGQHGYLNGTQSCGARMDPGGWPTATGFRLTGTTSACDIGNWSNSNISATTGTLATNQCPAYTDALTGTSYGAGEPLGYDGKCPTGSYTTSTEQALRDAAAQYPVGEASALQAFNAFNDWLHSGRPCDVCTGTTPANTGGPVTATGGPASLNTPPAVVTTTGPTGTTSTSTSDGYPIQYSPGTLGTDPATITWPNRTTTTNTTFTANSGAASGVPVTSTSTTTVTTQTAADAAKANAVTDCDKYPSNVGCMSIGTAPTDQVPVKSNVLTWVTETVSLPSSCPASVQVDATKLVSYGPICDAATNARPWVLIGAAFSSLMLVIVALRTL